MKKYILFAAALTVLAACNKDDNQPEASSDLVEIRLTSTLEAQTRATHDLDTKIAENETVHVWVDDAGTDAALYENNSLTVDSDGALNGDKMYFPSSGNGVDIYAIHGNFSSDLASFWDTEITHTVASDQQSSVTTAGSGYAVSDLVYCKSADVARTRDDVLLTFDHLLSKIEIVLKQGNGAPVVAKAEIINTQLQAAFTPAKTDDAITVTAAGTTGENAIAIDYDVTEDATEILNEAIIIPQTIASGTKFIRITTDEGGVLYYTLSNGATFESGKKYRYNITVDLTELKVTSTVSDWTSGGEAVDDSATMEIE